MKKLLAIFLSFVSACSGASTPDESSTIAMNPNDLEFNDYVHENLPSSLLERIKATTDVFEPIDSISFEQAIDLYRRDVDPEANLVIWEEMARVFASFCEKDCQSMEKKKEVYRALLLTSMWPKGEVINQLQPQILTVDEANRLISMYALSPVPITVIEK